MDCARAFARTKNRLVLMLTWPYHFWSRKLISLKDELQWVFPDGFRWIKPFPRHQSSYSQMMSNGCPITKTHSIEVPWNHSQFRWLDPFFEVSYGCHFCSSKTWHNCHFPCRRVFSGPEWWGTPGACPKVGCWRVQKSLVNVKTSLKTKMIM